jgi:hypothetical protein
VPWQNGQYYLFSKLLILNAAPSESGVFGLYNLHNNVFIAESANIRAALLRLYENMQRFGYEAPAGFTFELCKPHSRAARVKELLAEYDRKNNLVCPNILLYG